MLDVSTEFKNELFNDNRRFSSVLRYYATERESFEFEQGKMCGKIP